MKNTNLSPFHGKPATKLHHTKDGRPYYTITVSEFTPLQKKRFGAGVLGLIAFSFFLLITGMNFIHATFPSPRDLEIPWVITVIIFFAIANDKLFKTTWKMVITPDQFKVNDGWGWKKFDRNLEHQFALIPHDQTEIEKEEIELELNQMNERKKKKAKVSDMTFYGNSYHLSFSYLGQRNDIATIYGKKEAMAVITRLKACDAAMDGKTNAGTGTATSPGNEWNNEPGDID